MSLYIGTSDNTADLIASTISKATIQNLIEKYFMPNIGDVKYLAVPYFQQVDVTDDNFDGWVYADGSNIRVNSYDFRQAKQFFNVPLSATTLPIPNLCEFIQANPSNSKYTYSGSDMPCTDHKHDINTEIKYNSNNGSFILSTAFKIAVTSTESHVIVHPTNGTTIKIPSNKPDTWKRLLKKYSSFVPGLHGPGSSVSRSDHRVNIDLNIPSGVDFSVLPTKTTGEDYPNVYPAHVLLAVMLYIGRKES